MRLIDADKIQGDYFLEIHSNYIDDYAKGFQAGLNVVSNAPTIDAVPVKHGKWVGYQTNSFKNSSEGLKRKFYRCSICHTANAICAKYCPNCGAKMDEKEN